MRNKTRAFVHPTKAAKKDIARKSAIPVDRVNLKVNTMGVILREVRSGKACRIFAMGTESDCPLFSFIAELKGDDDGECSKLLALLQRSADHGTPKNKEKCRHLNNEKFFEFKTSGGARVMAFWDQDFFVVCSHGFMKQGQKTPKREIKRARKARDDYFSAKKSDNVRFV